MEQGYSFNRSYVVGTQMALIALLAAIPTRGEAQQRGAVVATNQGPRIDIVVQLAQAACAEASPGTYTTDEARAARAFLSLSPELNDDEVRLLGRQLGASWVVTVSALPDEDGATFVRFAIVDVDQNMTAISRFGRSSGPEDLPDLVRSNVTALLAEWSEHSAADSAGVGTPAPLATTPAPSAAMGSASDSEVPFVPPGDEHPPAAQINGSQGFELRARLGRSWITVCALPCTTSAARGVRDYGVGRSGQSDTVPLGELDIAGHQFDVAFHDQSDIRTGLGVGGAVALGVSLALILWGGLGGSTYMNGYDARGVPQYSHEWLIGPTIAGVVVFTAGAVMMIAWPNFHDYGTARRMDMHAEAQPLRVIAAALTSGVRF